MYNNGSYGGYSPYSNSTYNPYLENTYNNQNQANKNQVQSVPEQQNVVWIQVNGVNGAKDVAVQPNQTKWLMDINSQSFFVKSSDGLGVSTMKCYRFEEFDPNFNENNNYNKDCQYATKDEFEALKAKLEAYGKTFQKAPIISEENENKVQKKK